MPAVAQDKPMRGVALVIGESKYEQLPVLTNPGKDARDIDRLLGDLGFDVTRVLNADGDKMRDAISQFEDDAKDADVALIYYSGHGIEAKGANFIAPTDTDLSSPQTAGASMIAVQPILDELAKTTPVSIVLLDACRSDPFPAGQMIVLPGDTAPTPVEGQGLAPVRGPTPVAMKAGNPDSFGAVLGFSASPGEPALDGPPGENSPYAAALLKQFAAGGYSFGDVMTLVSQEVYLKTDAKQLPWTNSSLHQVLNFGAPVEDGGDPDQSAIKTERRKLLLSIASTPAPTQKYVEQLAGQEQVPLAALYGMLNALGVKTTDAGGDLQDQLAQGATRLKELLAQKTDAVKADPELERLSKLADEAEEEGAIALALNYRDQASSRADTLLQGKQAEAEKLRRDMADIADTYAANAATALLNFEQLHAADLYAKAFDATKDWDKAKALKFKIAQGDALTDRGYYHADNDAVTAALKVYADALQLAPEDSNPKEWARLENRIGGAQQTLGARMTDVALLNAAVASYELALTVQTRAEAPTDWAGVENNLGNVLFTLGDRTRDAPTLQKAVASFDAALTVFNQADDPVKWTTVQSNRAAAQMGLADAVNSAALTIAEDAVKSGNKQGELLPEVVAGKAKAVAILNAAASSLEGALKISTRDSNPLDWAMLQHTRASIIADRGKIAESADDLKTAVALYRDVMTVHDKTKTPVQWATSAGNLATTLRDYALMSKDPAPIAEAADLLQQAISLTPRAQSPLDWAEFQTKLGNVWADAVSFDQKPETVDKAVAAYSAALEIQTPELNIGSWEQLHVYIVSALLSTAVEQKDVARLKQARATAAEASEVLKAHNLPDVALFDRWLGVLDQFIEALSKQVAPAS